MSAGEDARWPSIAGLKLRLADDVEITRQEIRGALWYIVRDRLGHRFYRADPATYMFLSLLDGKRTVDEAYSIAATRLGDDAPGRMEIVRLFWRLNSSDLLTGDKAAKVAERAERGETLARRQILQTMKSPLAIRIRLFDPDPLLDRVRWLANIFFSPFGFALWAIVIAFGLINVGLNWDRLSGNFSDQVLSFDNLILLWFVFPVVKALHEIGHGLALKRWDCESRETGIMFLIFMPVPYVEASSTATLPSRWRRAAVGAAGLYVELFVAAIAAILWPMVEPGMFRAILFNVMLIGGVSAVLFNGNPLLRFDAYYVMSDLLEIPNMAQRATKWWVGLIQKAIGVEDVEDPVEAPGERGWLIFYGSASWLYRMFLMSVIVLFVSQQFFYLGLIFAAMAVTQIFLVPIFKGLKFLFTSHRLSDMRALAMIKVAAALGAIVLLIGFAPAPSRSMAEGVVWYASGGEVRPAATGYVADMFAENGQTLSEGEPIARLIDRELEVEIASLQARIAALEAQLRRELAEERRRAPLTREELRFTSSRLAESLERRNNLMIRSPADGVLAAPEIRRLLGGWLTRGQALGHVAGEGPMIVRVVVRQEDAERVRKDLNAVEVRLAGAQSTALPAKIIRETPRATDILPSPLLSVSGGGSFSLNPAADPDMGLRALESFFIFDVALPEDATARFGERAWIRFDHPWEPLATQWRRSLRNLLLEDFDV